MTDIDPISKSDLFLIALVIVGTFYATAHTETIDPGNVQEIKWCQKMANFWSVLMLAFTIAAIFFKAEP